MKRSSFLFALLFLMHFCIQINNCEAQWVQTNGIGFDRSVNCFSSNTNYLFAGVTDYPSSTDGVYLSSNNGLNWNQTSLNNIIYALTTIGDNIFAGTSFGVYKSTNNGTNWYQTSLNYVQVTALTVNGNNIFAGTNDSGIYFSTNNGTSWTKTSMSNYYIKALAVSGNNIFAGTDHLTPYGVFISTNNGINWNQTSLNNLSIQTLVVNGNYIFAGTDYNGIYISTNNGANWSQTSLNNKSVLSLAATGSNVIAGIWEGGIYVSTNNGTDWFEKNQGFNFTPTVRALVISNNYILEGNYQHSVWRRSLSEIIGIQNISTETPSKYSLSQNYPNPFNSTSNLKFEISNTGDVKLIVYDIMGKKVQTLVNESLKPGTYKAAFDGSALNSGVYFYKLVTGNFTETKKMLLIK